MVRKMKKIDWKKNTIEKHSACMVCSEKLSMETGRLKS
jgi:hypothetical protein